MLDPRFQKCTTCHVRIHGSNTDAVLEVNAMAHAETTHFARHRRRSRRRRQTVAPTPEQVGPARGENTADYNITNSFETGYRFSLIGGDLGMYRSDVNYGNGLRLLGSNLTIDSKDGHGHFFDEILLNTWGWATIRTRSATLRIQKNRLYRYDMLWRLNDYLQSRR